MLALSPLFPTLGFPTEEQISQEHNWTSNDSLVDFNHKEWNRLDSFGSSCPLDETDQLHYPKHSSGASSDQCTAKKQNHNASERDRRQKLNSLYSTLRSVLPGTDQKKKLSIPSTISQALRYIPQLQNQVETLLQRKKEILSSIPKQSDNLPYYPKKNRTAKGESLPIVSTCQIGQREAVIQICTSKINRSTFSDMLQMLEKDEIQLLNSSAIAPIQNKVFYTLHVKAKETQRVECEVLNQKILSIC
ncbi:hypothetical protein IFM89_005235 [Coptis chinensis]|uniref:BHLH domain-containing protein n=1 Tax=Coptis chinensis TaxID=261450 RepID=A0A835LH76_9MAGN|nr:hypothetical protein IFM89_005235 [Coptis chinensis]